MVDNPKITISRHQYRLLNPYSDALTDVRWKIRRQQIIERDKGQCVICRSTENLQVHHRQYHFYTRLNKYASPWEYPDDVLITLCERCHKAGHSQYAIPVINI